MTSLFGGCLLEPQRVKTNLIKLTLGNSQVINSQVEDSLRKTEKGTKLQKSLVCVGIRGNTGVLTLPPL